MLRCIAFIDMVLLDAQLHLYVEDVCMHKCVCAYLHIYIHIYIYARMCISIHIHRCMYAFLYLCMCIYIYISIHVCLHIHMGRTVSCCSDASSFVRRSVYAT